MNAEDHNARQDNLAMNLVRLAESPEGRELLEFMREQCGICPDPSTEGELTANPFGKHNDPIQAALIEGERNLYRKVMKNLAAARTRLAKKLKQ